MPSRFSRPAAACLASLLTVCGLAATAAAQDAPVRATTGNPSRDTIIRMTRPVTVEFQDKRLEDVVTFIQTSTAAELEPLWADDRNPEGLDKEKLITVRVTNQTYLTLLEKVLEQAKGDVGGDNTWQMSDTGAMQVGPKERLNKYKRMEIYDINDLLLDVPDYTEVPRIDLQQALQSNQGGGGGQSPFRDAGNDQQNQRLRDRQQRAEDLVSLITQIVESDQWVDNGGSGGTIRFYPPGSLIVNAPDYMHRGIDGYKFWPSRSTSAAMVNGRRYVTLNGDTGLARVLGFGQSEVSAVVGGRVIRSGGPPGGQTAPGGGGKGPGGKR